MIISAAKVQKNIEIMAESIKKNADSATISMIFTFLFVKLDKCLYAVLVIHRRSQFPHTVHRENRITHVNTSNSHT